MRQFWDMRESVELNGLDTDDFTNYAKICALLLARGHAQSPTAGMVRGYIGKKKKLVNSLVDWANAYSKQVHQDYKLFKEAYDTGKLAEEES